MSKAKVPETGEGYLGETMVHRISRAMGADALLIEVHPNPAEAWSDGAQQVSLDGFASLMKQLRPFIQAAGRTVG